jgi:hypothetical protein
MYYQQAVGGLLQVPGPTVAVVDLNQRRKHVLEEKLRDYVCRRPTLNS